MNTAIYRCVVMISALFMFIAATLAHGEALQQAQISPDQLDQLQWATTSRGIQEARMIGDPARSGIYVVRSKYPRGLRIEPHFHPDDRIVTVLSGTIYLGYGKKFDERKMKALPAGSVWTEPANQPHFSWAKDSGVLIQIIGYGPSGVINVRP